MSDDCVRTKTEYFRDVALLRIVVEIIGLRDIPLGVSNDMAVFFAIGFMDCN